mgnify:CR=1 FL=1
MTGESAGQDELTRQRREAAMQELTAQRDAYRKKEGISKGRRGLLIVNTGNGKGKTTAALGLMMRAHGRGLKVKMFQFLKHDTAKFGEHRTLDMLEVPYQGLGDGWTWRSKDLENSAELAAHGWELAKEAIQGGEFDLIVVDTVSVKEAKTASLRETLGKLGWTKALIIAGPEVDTNFGLAARNIPHIDVLPNAGLNVYDILRADKLVLTKAAVEAIERSGIPADKIDAVIVGSPTLLHIPWHRECPAKQPWMPSACKKKACWALPSRLRRRKAVRECCAFPGSGRTLAQRSAGLLPSRKGLR